MRISTVCLLALALMFAVGTTMAQQERGDVELQLVGTYFQTVGVDDYSFGSGTISGRIGYYFTDNFEFGLGPSLSISTVTTHTQPTYTYDPNTGRLITTGGGSETNTTTTFGSYAFFVYSFLTRGGKLVPYVGAQYFKSDFSQDFEQAAGNVGINAGVKYFFTKKVAFDIGGNYMWDLTKDAKGGIVFFAVGLSFLI